MARNSEKAQSMLYRFRSQQASELGIVNTGMDRRPRAVTSVTSAAACEKWRGQVVREISRLVTKIHDPSLTDYQIRDTNDQINKMMKEKFLWELQLRNLGGPNYMRGAGVQFDAEGREVPGNRGYKYFGRAKELPGVKELFEELRPKEPTETKKRLDLRSQVNADYYGYRDEDDQALLEYEAAQEELALSNTLKQQNTDFPRDWQPIPPIDTVPNRAQVEEWLLERRKQKLLEQYT